MNGTIRVRNQLNVGDTTEQNLFVDGGAGGQYVKMGNYGQGNYFGISTDINRLNMLRHLEVLVRWLKKDDNYNKSFRYAFQTCSTGTTLIPNLWIKGIILPFEILIYKDTGTTGTDYHQAHQTLELK